MRRSTSLATTAALAVLTLATVDLSASAQDLTNGPDGSEPNTLRSKTRAGRMPSRAIMTPGSSMHRRTSDRYGDPRARYAAARPLVVRPVAPAVVAAPAPVGPATIVTGPLAFGSELAALPFRTLGTIFPASGDLAANPLVIVGAPLRAAGDLAQVPFRVVGAAFGQTATY